MKFFFIILFYMIGLDSSCQLKKTLYCFPGQGSDRRLFDSLTIDTSLFDIQVIEYDTPDKSMTLKDFARKLSCNIDTTKEFILIGVSLGGMICAELNEFLHPVKTIIISSAKNRNELPARYKFQKILPIYKLLPGKLLLWGAKILQPIVEPDRNKNKQTFKSMLSSKNGVYMKRTIKMIINWERTSNSKILYHIHGTNDHTLPIENIENPDYIITNGSHMMTLTRAKEISIVLNVILTKEANAPLTTQI